MTTPAELARRLQRIAEHFSGEALAAERAEGRDAPRLRAFEAALTEAADMLEAMGWRTMESAPRDGTSVLLRCKGRTQIQPGRYWSADAIAFDEDEGLPPDDYQAGWYASDDNLSELAPTHWMPLPPAPSED